MVTYNGQVPTLDDAIILFEACRLGLLPRVQQRLTPNQRKSIKSGSVFVWDEQEAGMQRWTDGRSWSTSRVLNNSLLYREMIGSHGGGRLALLQTSKGKHASKGESTTDENEDVDNRREDGYRENPVGLIKRSFSIKTLTGNHLHLISYYARKDLNSSSLQRPSTDPRLRHVVPDNNMYQSTIDASPRLGTKRDSPVHYFVHTPSYAKPSTLILTPPTPAISPDLPHVASRHTSFENIRFSNNHSLGFQESRRSSLFERLTPPLHDDTISPPPPFNPADGQRTFQHNTLDQTVPTPKFHCSSTMPTLNQGAPLGCVRSSVIKTSRSRSKSLSEYGEWKRGCFMHKKRIGWIEDQRAIAALDRTFMS